MDGYVMDGCQSVFIYISSAYISLSLYAFSG